MPPCSSLAFWMLVSFSYPKGGLSPGIREHECRHPWFTFLQPYNPRNNRGLLEPPHVFTKTWGEGRGHVSQRDG